LTIAKWDKPILPRPTRAALTTFLCSDGLLIRDAASR
jgi:hypothetical protein